MLRACAPHDSAAPPVLQNQTIVIFTAIPIKTRIFGERFLRADEQILAVVSRAW
jgi:hypothetical protein